MSSAAIGVIRVRLLAGAPASLFGAPPRVYPYVAPQGCARPYYIFGRVDARPEYHMRGEGGLSRTVCQIEGWFDTDLQMHQADEFIRSRLSGFRGPVQVDGVTYDVRRMHIVSESQDAVPPQSGGTALFHLTKELEIDVSQSIPLF